MRLLLRWKRRPEHGAGFWSIVGEQYRVLKARKGILRAAMMALGVAVMLQQKGPFYGAPRFLDWIPTEDVHEAITIAADKINEPWSWLAAHTLDGLPIDAAVRKVLSWAPDATVETAPSGSKRIRVWKDGHRWCICLQATSDNLVQFVM